MRESLVLFLVLAIAGCEGRSADRSGSPPAEQPSTSDDPRQAPGTSQFDGVYCTAREISGSSGTILELKGEKFRYWFYSDLIGPDGPEYTITGSYRVVDGKLVLDHGQVTQKEWFPDVINGVPVLFRDDALKIWREQGRLYDYGILIKAPSADLSDDSAERPSITVLYDEEMKKRLEDRKDPDVRGPR